MLEDMLLYCLKCHMMFFDRYHEKYDLCPTFAFTWALIIIRLRSC